MLPEQSCFTFQSMSQLQVPSLQKPWELQSSSIKQTYAREIKRIILNIPINRKYSFKFECEYFKRWLGHGIKFYQGIIKRKNWRLSTEIPNYQTILAANRLLDTLKHNFNSFNLTCYILSKSTHHDNQKMNPIQVHNHIWFPHKPPCHYNHHRLHTKTLQDIF